MTSSPRVEPLPMRHRRRATHSRPRPSVGNVLLGLIGELLITAGVLIGLFVVWQVYYTDVIGQREASQHLSVFEADAPEVAPRVAEEKRELAPVEFGEGQFAVLYVPRWGEDYRMPIAEGTGPEIIDEGYVGHYPDTQLPGEIGNFALAGHRQSRGKPFRHVDSLQEGDPIIVRTKEHFYVYRVSENRIVYPTQTEVLAPNPFEPFNEPEEAVLTITTCHPLWSIRERWIVHAELDYWTDVADGRPADLPEGSL